MVQSGLRNKTDIDIHAETDAIIIYNFTSTHMKSIRRSLYLALIELNLYKTFVANSY